MNTKNEMNVAEEIVSVLPSGSVARVCSDDRETIRFAVRSADLPLREIILRRSSLRRLIEDPARNVKVEYLQRELIRSAGRRARFEYPNASRIVAAIARATQLRRIGTPMALAVR
ncbi:MAG: hypothetical protein JOZ54_23865 [Acidobacteria bacterium]|nr:hypothetical protein [Acidobacteriota bacterium]